MKQNIGIAYHCGDLDGIMAAHLVSLSLSDSIVTFIKADYNIVIPADICNYDQLIIVDFSYSVEEMMMLQNYYGNNLSWYDHHEARNVLIDTVVSINGKRQYDISATEIVYNELCNDSSYAEVVRLVSDYDLFLDRNQSTWFTRTLPFQLGYKALNITVDDVSALMNIDAVISNGLELLQSELVATNALLATGTIVHVQGHRTLLVYAAFVNNAVIDNNTCDYSILAYYWAQPNGQIKLSFRSIGSVNTAVISKSIGINGGGHPAASGTYFNTMNALRKEVN